MTEQKMITVVAAQPSKSGKTLSVRDQDDIWYQSKDFTIANMIGTAMLINWNQQNFPDGGAIKWLNDYTLPAVNQYAGATAQGEGSPQNPAPPSPPSVDRDASIVAQALCKTLRHDTAKQALGSYTWIYASYQEWAVNPLRQEPEVDEGIHDDIPY